MTVSAQHYIGCRLQVYGDAWIVDTVHPLTGALTLLLVQSIENTSRGLPLMEHHLEPQEFDEILRGRTEDGSHQARIYLTLRAMKGKADHYKHQVYLKQFRPPPPPGREEVADRVLGMPTGGFWNVDHPFNLGLKETVNTLMDETVVGMAYKTAKETEAARQVAKIDQAHIEMRMAAAVATETATPVVPKKEESLRDQWLRAIFT